MWLLIITIAVVLIVVFVMGANKRAVQKKKSNMSVAEATKLAQETFEAVYGHITYDQKMASANLLLILAATCKPNGAQYHQIHDVIASYCGSLGIDAKSFKHIITQHPSIKDVVGVLKQIPKKDNFFTHFLFTCWTIVSITKSEDGIVLLQHVFGELGYSSEELINEIQKLNALDQMYLGEDS